MQPTAANALNSTTASIFTGTVLSQKKPLDKEKQEIISIVSIDRLIKGCSLKKSERIVVTTASSSAGCGVNFTVGESYFFTGDIEKLDTDLLLKTYGLNFKKPIKSTVHASSCSFNILKQDVTTKDRAMLVEYGKTKNICPIKCNIGTDCLSRDYFCDSGYCKLFAQQCPPDIPLVQCFADPCAVTTPCSDNLQCTRDYCGTCTAIFTDANRTRTCLI